jgi:diguanylate cyclase (GGDEF)-like protein
MDSYFFILTTIDLFVLGFMSLLTKLSESLNKKQKRGFLLAFALIACISVLEVITIVVDGAPTGCRWLNILSNYLGFGLTPAVALCLVYVLDKKSIIRRGFKAAVCCEGAYLLFLAATLPYGLVFSVSRENLYARGEYFYIYVAMYYAAMLYLMVATVHTAAAFQNRTAEMRRSGGVLVVFDVDSFKQINDRYGHLQGDVCLAEIADCIKKAYARCGYCYRIGGDEFCVLLRDAADEARCTAALQSLLAERRKEITLLPTVSHGSAVFSGEDVVTVKDRADRALYCAKNELKARAAAAMPAGGSGEKD